MKIVYKTLLAFLIFTFASFQVIQASESKSSSAKSVRLAAVITPVSSGMLDYILTDFENESGYSVDIYSGSDVYERAKEGKADIVISHYGKHQVEGFIKGGYGIWPKMVFSNQAVIIGPKSDPAGIKGMTNAPEALLNIVNTNSCFVQNLVPTAKYLSDILWEQAGKPEKNEWFIGEPVVNAQAADLAVKKNAYFIWGAGPFLKYQKKIGNKMEIMVSADPVMQRVMASIVVSDKKVGNINTKGAEALQAFLLKAETQAKIAKFRVKGYEHQLWWPAGRFNYVGNM